MLGQQSEKLDGNPTLPFQQLTNTSIPRSSILAFKEESISKPFALEELPIAPYLNQIATILERDRVVVVTSPTGSGKSTYIPFNLEQRGYRVVVTEPRVLAATSLAEWVSHQYKEECGGLVGYRTGDEKLYSDRSRIIYCTDGLQLIRELLKQTRDRDVLMIDEFHERNLNQDVLLAWSKRQLQRDPKLKLIVTSATVDAQKISAYLDGAKIIHAQGRTFPITQVEKGKSIEDDVVSLVAEGKNILVFQPGKREIRHCINGIIKQLEASNLHAHVLPLHRDLSLLEQKACFAQYPHPKVVVATNIAEASITIPDIQAVVDSGRSRIILTNNGVQGLHTTWISKAEKAQRAGRAGRTQAGIAIWHGPDPESLHDYPLPEISRLQTANFYLRILSHSGIQPKNLEYLDPPPISEFPQAKLLLNKLDCLTDSGEVTKLGRRIALLPVSVNLGRFILEAYRYGVLDQAQKVAAIIEAGSIVNPEDSLWKEKFCKFEHSSDLLAQLSVFNHANELFENQKFKEITNFGVNLRSLKRAREHLENLHKRFQPEGDYKACREEQVSGRLIKSFLKGFPDGVYYRTSKGWCNGEKGNLRVLCGESVVPRDADYIVCIPWDSNQEVSGAKDKTRLLIKWASVIDHDLVPREVIMKKHKLEKEAMKKNSGKQRGTRNRSGRR